jgi:hypothetical protein
MESLFRRDAETGTPRRIRPVADETLGRGGRLCATQNSGAAKRRSLLIAYLICSTKAGKMR